VDPTLPLPKAQVAPEPAPLPVSEPMPKAPSKLRIRTRYGYPIYIPYLERRIRPDEIAELDDHPWLRRQIELNTFILLED
jgi:hypothetical protein